MTDEEKKKQPSQPISRGLGDSAQNLPDPNEDPELRTLLRQWQLPRSSSKFDRSVLKAYRNQVSSNGGWKRLFSCSIPIPLPVATALLLVLAFLGSRTLRPPVVHLQLPGPVPQVVQVEVPVVREKIVTRIVYRQSPDTRNAGKALENDMARSAANFVTRGPRSSQIAVQLDDFEPVEKIQLKILKGVDQ